MLSWTLKIFSRSITPAERQLNVWSLIYQAPRFAREDDRELVRRADKYKGKKKKKKTNALRQCTALQIERIPATFAMPHHRFRGARVARGSTT